MFTVSSIEDFKKYFGFNDRANQDLLITIKENLIQRNVSFLQGENGS
jgi:hypothetical protein